MAVVMTAILFWGYNIAFTYPFIILRLCHAEPLGRRP